MTDPESYRAGLEAAAMKLDVCAKLSSNPVRAGFFAEIAGNIRALPVPDGERAEDDGDIAVRIVRAVAEIPDRYSPPDNPDMMQVTLQELHAIVRSALRAARGL